MPSDTKFPTPQEVADRIHEIAYCYLEKGDECDIRLQVYEDGSWAVRWGLSDYDQDHHGYWGDTSIVVGDHKGPTPDWLVAVANDLCEQAADDAANQEG